MVLLTYGNKETTMTQKLTKKQRIQAAKTKRQMELRHALTTKDNSAIITRRKKK